MASNDDINDDITLPDLEGRPSRRKKNKKKDLQEEGYCNMSMIEYNSFGVPVGKGRNDLRSYIGIIVRETVSIVYDDWRTVPLELKETLWQHFQKKFKLSLKSKVQVLKWMGVSLRNFRSELVNEFILPNKDDPQSLKLPPIEFPSIKRQDWKYFVKKVMSEEFQLKSKNAKDRRALNKYNHRLGSTGYGGMLHRKHKEIGISERDIDRSEAWLMARQDQEGKYAPEVMEVADKINDLKTQIDQGSFRSQGTKDVLSEAIQKQPNGSRVQGLGQFITPSMYFYIPDHSELLRERKKYEESFQFMTAQLEFMNARLNANSKTEVGSSNYPKMKVSNASDKLEVEQSPGNVPKRKEADISLKKLTPRSVKSKLHLTRSPKENFDEVISKITPTKAVSIPRRSPRLTPSKKEKTDMQIVKQEKVPKKRPMTTTSAARKLILKKSTRGAEEARKQELSAYMTLFNLMVENSLPDIVVIDHEKANFGIEYQSYIDKKICKEIIDFKEVSNCGINIWIKYLYEEMEKGGIAKPVQFGNCHMIRPSKTSFKDGPQYVSKVLGLTDLGQVVVFPYNPGFHWVLFVIDMVRRTIYYLDSMGSNPDDDLMKIVNQGIRIYQSVQNVATTKTGGLKWISVKCPQQLGTFECGYYVMKYMQDIISNVDILKNNFNGIDVYTVQEISQLRDQWATYVTKLITEYNHKNLSSK